MSEIITAGPLKFSEPNCPTRVGEIVENIEDIYSIPTPRLGMMVFVKNKGRHYTITSLKSAVIGGVEVPNAQVDSFEPVATENVGNVDSLDGFTDNGIYQGYHVVSGEVFVLVVINNHAVAAQMGMPTISQFKYSVNMRGQVSFEQRTKDSIWGEWCKVNEPWIVSQLEEIERNLFEYINKSIKDVTDGIDPEKIDSLKDLIAWVEEHGGTVNALWKSIEENAGRITSETKRAKQAEDELRDAIQLNYEDIKRLDTNKAERSDAMQYNTLGVNVFADKAEIYGRSISGTPRTFEFPAATTESAGVMSAADKEKLDNIAQGGGGGGGDITALRSLFVAAGAEYNDTDQIIQKTTFWGEEVGHLPKHYYLNGLGDITEEQMMEIYNYKDVMYWIMAGVNCARLFQDITSPRTLFAPKDSRYAMNQAAPGWSYLFVNDIEVVKFWHANTWKPEGNLTILNEDIFYNNHGLKVVDTFKQGKLNGINAPKLTHIRAVLIKSFSVKQSSLITKDSVLYMINKFVVPSSNATSNTPYTITLHPDAYAKCIEGGEWYEEINTAWATKNEALSAKNYSLNLVSA